MPDTPSGQFRRRTMSPPDRSSARGRWRATRSPSSPRTTTTVARRPVRPRRCALTNAARCRSHRPASARHRAPIRADGCDPRQHLGKSIFARSGTAGRLQTRPSSLTAPVRRSLTDVACGLPMSAAAGSATAPPRGRESVSVGRASGHPPSRAAPGRYRHIRDRRGAPRTADRRLPWRMTWMRRPAREPVDRRRSGGDAQAPARRHRGCGRA